MVDLCLDWDSPERSGEELSWMEDMCWQWPVLEQVVK